MKIALSSVFSLISTIVIASQSVAEPKQLVCIDPDVEGTAATARQYEAESSPGGDSPDAEQAAQWRAYAEHCETVGEYGSKFVVVFDTDSLTTGTGDAEVSGYNWCGARLSYDGSVLRAQISSTPSIITFSYVIPGYPTSVAEFANRAFNVDRRNLAAGPDTDRNFQCTLEDVDVSENLL